MRHAVSGSVLVPHSRNIPQAGLEVLQEPDADTLEHVVGAVRDGFTEALLEAGRACQYLSWRPSR
jgi:hypothetical protein